MELWVWSIMLLAIGFSLIALELFIPSGGLLGVLAAVAILGSVIVGFNYRVWLGGTMLIVTAILIPVMFSLFVKYWPKTPLGRLIFSPPLTSDEVMPKTEEYQGLSQLIGRRGKAASKMLPSGDVKIDGRRYDAVSDGMPIEIGQPVRVVAVRTNRIVVRPVDPDEPPPRTEADDVLSQPIETVGLESLDEPLA